MKNIKKVQIIAGSLMIILLSMCNIDAHFGLKGSGKVVEQERSLPIFSAIEASGGINVYISQGESQKVVVVTDDNIQPLVLTKVENNVLKVFLDKWSVRASTLKILITIKDIKSVSCSGGTDAYSESPIIVSSLQINLSGGSDANFNLKADEISGSMSGGSDLMLKGTSGTLKIEASGGSDCKAFDLITSKADVSASGGSDIFITVNEELIASASGGSDIKYKGNAKIIKSESSGGSDIIKE